jgi:hypothetical protein
MLPGLPARKERPFGKVSGRLTVPILTEIGNEPKVPAAKAAVLGVVKTGVLFTVMVYGV